MKLTDATELMKLRQRVVTKNSLTAVEVAKKVFQISAAYGEPYETVTPEIWAKMWLGSRKFYLAEIAPFQVAVPYANKIDGEKVRRAINASADGNMEPIVVDINRQGIGKTVAGYIPKVIVVDGKHRHKAQLQMGKDRILAWVGDLALQELQRRQEGGKRFVIEAAAGSEKQSLSPLLASASLFAAIAVPSGNMPRQDTGDGGSRPTGAAKMASAGAGGGMGGSLGGGSGLNPAMTKLNSQGSRSSGSLEDADPSDTNITPDPSDTGPSVDPSDRQNWNPDKPQLCAPGCDKDHIHDYGVGKSFGGKKGDFNRGKLLEAGPVKVKKIVTKKKNIEWEPFNKK